MSMMQQWTKEKKKKESLLINKTKMQEISGAKQSNTYHMNHLREQTRD